MPAPRIHLQVWERNGPMKWRRPSCPARLKQPRLTTDPGTVTCLQCMETKLFRQASAERHSASKDSK